MSEANYRLSLLEERKVVEVLAWEYTGEIWAPWNKTDPSWISNTADPETLHNTRSLTYKKKKYKKHKKGREKKRDNLYI